MSRPAPSWPFDEAHRPEVFPFIAVKDGTLASQGSDHAGVARLSTLIRILDILEPTATLVRHRRTIMFGFSYRSTRHTHQILPCRCLCAQDHGSDVR